MDLTTPLLYYLFDFSWSWLENNVFYCNREESPSTKRSFLSICNGWEFGDWGALPLGYIVHPIGKLNGRLEVLHLSCVRIFMCAIFFVCLFIVGDPCRML